MYPQTHFFAGVFLARILYLFNALTPVEAFVLVFITFFIDTDHAVSFFYYTKSLNIVRLFKSVHKSKYIKRTWLHYEVGFLLILFISFILLVINLPGFGLAVLLGYVLHIILDHYSFNVFEFKNLNNGLSVHEKVILVFLIFADVVLFII